MAVARPANPNGALVELVGNPLDEATRFAPPDQFDGAGSAPGLDGPLPGVEAR